LAAWPGEDGSPLKLSSAMNPNPCRLYLLTPRLRLADLDAFAPRFAAALAAGDVASALARLAPDAGGDAKRIVGRLLEAAVAADVALLVEHDPRLAARVGADGAHVGTGQLAEAISSLQPERIVGAGGLRQRDDAMNAGEAGVDYVMFGEPNPDGRTPPFEDTLELAEWWSEIFQTPCVAFAATLESVAPLAAAGVDFVALGDAVWSSASPDAAVAEATRRASTAASART
jgi:thiamine-phosphate pyrophosphorylase